MEPVLSIGAGYVNLHQQPYDQVLVKFTRR